MKYIGPILALAVGLIGLVVCVLGLFYAWVVSVTWVDLWPM